MFLKRIAILMTCHNRVEITLGCLRKLFVEIERFDDFSCKVFLVDDGSVDGTGTCVRKTFPQVRVIDGDGTLFWARGMALAWKTAVEECDWDGYLWLNDDTMLNGDAIQRMMAMDDGEKIVVGELVNAKGEYVYGSRVGGLFTGNCVLVPRKVYDKLGMICGGYAHAWADSDYAMRAQRLGIDFVSAGIVGEAEWHPNRPSLKGRTFAARMRLLRDPKGWDLHDLWLYRRRNWGLCRALASCAHLIAHVMRGER